MTDYIWEDDKAKDECGVLGIYGPGLDVAGLVYYGLYALQHRGQQSAGIAVANEKGLTVEKSVGLVSQVFNEDNISRLHGKMALGHVRYAMAGDSAALIALPLIFEYANGSVALAHNGSIVNAQQLRRELSRQGSIFQSTTDSELIANMLARYSQNSIEEGIMQMVHDIKGAYSLAIMTENKMIALRDPHGLRPFCLGKLGDAYVLASESCALDVIGATLLRDIRPGEMLIIDENGLVSVDTIVSEKKAHCIFEYVYLARPDSKLDGFVVNSVRKEMGRQLAREYKIDADVVMPVPDSGIAAARGYAEQSGIPFEDGLHKNRYIGRTFIQPSQEMRDMAVRIKLNPIKEVLEGKRIILVDDSIVRGTTSRYLVQHLRDAGAKEVHMMISSPPVINACYYGIDTKNREELIAVREPLDKIAEVIGADSVNYLSRRGLYAVFGNQNNFCDACFSSNYPVPVTADKQEDIMNFR